MAKSSGSVIHVNPNRVSGTVQDSSTGTNYVFEDDNLPSKGIVEGNKVWFDIVIIANVQVAIGLSLIPQTTPA